jgi:ankyrin repeat protein
VVEASVNQEENQEPIDTTSRMEYHEIFTLFLRHGAILEYRTDSGNTAEHLASESGHLRLVKYLVQVQKDGMHSLNYENQTPSTRLLWMHA